MIGLERLKVVHVNDSKNPMGSHKDRHANIGFGTIGFDTLNTIVHHEKLKDLPKNLGNTLCGRRQKEPKTTVWFRDRYVEIPAVRSRFISKNSSAIK